MDVPDGKRRPSNLTPRRQVNRTIAWSFGVALHVLAAIQAVRFYIKHPNG